MPKTPPARRPKPPPGPATAPANPWDRQPGESDTAFHAFAAFRDLGPKRTMTEAYQQTHPDGPALAPPGSKRAAGTALKRPGCPSGAWRRYSKAFRWLERARAYDEANDRARTGAVTRAVAAAATRQATDWAGRLVDLNQQVYDQGQEILAQAMILAAFPVVTRTVNQGAAGEVHVYRASPPTELAAAAKLAESGQSMCYRACEAALKLAPPRPSAAQTDAAAVVAEADALLADFHNRHRDKIFGPPPGPGAAAGPVPARDDADDAQAVA